MAETLNKTFTPYQPKPDEEYMNKHQLNHFRKILNDWKSELSHDIEKTVHTMRPAAVSAVTFCRPTRVACGPFLTPSVMGCPCFESRAKLPSHVNEVRGSL